MCLVIPWSQPCLLKCEVISGRFVTSLTSSSLSFYKESTKEMQDKSRKHILFRLFSSTTCLSPGMMEAVSHIRIHVYPGQNVSN